MGADVVLGCWVWSKWSNGSAEDSGIVGDEQLPAGHAKDGRGHPGTEEANQHPGGGEPHTEESPNPAELRRRTEQG